MNPSHPAALKRGTTDADSSAVTHPSARRPRLLVAVASALCAVVATALPLTTTLAEDRGSADPAATDIRQASRAAVSFPLEELLLEGDDPPPYPAPAAPPEQPEAPPAPEPVPPVSEPDPCSEARTWAEQAGLALPPGVGYRCPSTQFPHHGAACWNAAPCRGTAFIAVNLELIGSPTPEYIRHVVAHEVCHILDFQAKGWTTEADADACAAAHGA